MEAQMLDGEVELLVWMHEHARGFDAAYGFWAETVAVALGIDELELARRVTFLEGFNLAGCAIADRTHMQSPHPECALIRVWLTAHGENYVRVLETKPGVPKRLTLATLKTAAGVVRDAASMFLAQIAVAQLRGGSA